MQGIRATLAKEIDPSFTTADKKGNEKRKVDVNAMQENPTKDNPAYKDDWHLKYVSNPDYKGVWEVKKIFNPLYKVPDRLTADEASDIRQGPSCWDRSRIQYFK